MKKFLIFAILVSIVTFCNVNAKDIVISPNTGLTSGYAQNISGQENAIGVVSLYQYGGLRFYGSAAGGSYKALGASYNISSSGCYNLSVTASFPSTSSFGPNSFSAFLKGPNNSLVNLINTGISTQQNQTQGNSNSILSAYRDNICLDSGSYNIIWYLGGMTFSANQYYGFGNIVLSELPNNQLVTEQQNTTNAVNKTNDTLNDDDTSESSSSFNSFSDDDNFKDSHGLDSIIKLPLNMVNSLSSSCSNISLTIPYIDTDVSLPCMSTIYQEHISTIYELLKIVINGFIIYRVLIELVSIVKGLQSPDSDKVEVLDL